MIRLLTGDCRDVLATLPAASVHCVVTSPPYYGLRDYGTAQWDGGDAGCDHARPSSKVGGATTLRNDGREHVGLYDDEKAATPGYPYRDICGKCGARRIDRQLGLESSPEEYLATMVQVFREVKRVLRDDGTCWVNLGDSYNANQGSGFNGNAGKPTASPRMATGLAAKQLLMMPARLALALQADGWWLRSDIIWAKPNPMPESCRDRPTSAHEHVFLLTKRSRYFYDADAVREPHDGPHAQHIQRHLAPEAPRGDSRTLGGRQGLHDFVNPAGRNLRNVWNVATFAYPAAHFATFPPELAERCIRAGTSERGCCAACGKPWVRVTERTGYTLHTHYAPAPNKGHLGAVGERAANMTRDGFIPNRDPVITTTGWSPGCQCKSLRCVSCAFVLDTIHANGKANTKQNVPDVRGDIQTVGPSSQVLQPAVLREPAIEGSAPPLSSMQEAVHAHIEPGAALQHGMRADMDRPHSLDLKGLDDNQQGLQAPSQEEPSERDGRWLRDGASSGDGEEAGTASYQGRGGPPQERQQAGQSTIQFGVDGEAGARRSAETALHCDVPSLPEGVSDERQCPHCGSRTEWTTSATSPCVVLDCFSGAGTALLVADRLGRDAIGIDLSHAYVEMARERLQADCPLFASIEPSPPPAEDPEDERMADLFAWAAD